MRVRVLASSSAGNAAVLEAEGGARLLLDAGVRYRDLQRALGHRVTSLDACLLGHEHQDHAKAAPELLKATVPVYATRGTLDAAGLAGHRTHALVPLQPTKIGAWTVVALPTIHDAAEPCGFLVAHGGEKALYLTDTGFCPYRFQGLTTILLEANYSSEILTANADDGTIPPAHAARVLRNHMSVERAIELLQANDLAQVREIHLLHLSDSNSHAERFKSMVERATGKPVRVADAREAEGTP